MLYGTLITSYTKGTTDILLFQQKGLAKMISRIFEKLWNKKDVENIDIEQSVDYEALFEDVNKNIYATIEDINKNNWEEVNKNVKFFINENGLVHPTYSNIRLINLNNTIYVP